MEEMPVRECSIINKLVRRRKTGYQRYRRLSKEEKKCFTKSKLPINQKILALAYKSFTKSSLELSLKWAKNHWRKYVEAERDYFLYCRKNNIPIKQISEKHAYKEFIFKGYVPEEDFQKIPRCNYIVSNRLIRGIRFIYPFHFGHDYKTLQKYPDVYLGISLTGIQGYTRVNIKYSL